MDLVSDQSPSFNVPPWSKRRREKEAKKMPGEERLPEEQWKRVVMRRSLRERSLDEITQLNISSTRESEVPFGLQRG